MNMNEQMKESEESILHTYNRFPVVFEKGQGCYLYDSEGKEYLDFAAGIAVNSLGYHYPGYDEADADRCRNEGVYRRLQESLQGYFRYRKRTG